MAASGGSWKLGSFVSAAALSRAGVSRDELGDLNSPDRRRVQGVQAQLEGERRRTREARRQERLKTRPPKLSGDMRSRENFSKVADFARAQGMFAEITTQTGQTFIKISPPGARVSPSGVRAGYTATRADLALRFVETGRD